MKVPKYPIVKGSPAFETLMIPIPISEESHKQAGSVGPDPFYSLCLFLLFAT